MNYYKKKIPVPGSSVRLLHVRVHCFLLGCCYSLDSEWAPEAHVLKSWSPGCYWEVVENLRYRTWWEALWLLGVCP